MGIGIILMWYEHGMAGKLSNYNNPFEIISTGHLCERERFSPYYAHPYSVSQTWFTAIQSSIPFIAPPYLLALLAQADGLICQSYTDCDSCSSHTGTVSNQTACNCRGSRRREQTSAETLGVKTNSVYPWDRDPYFLRGRTSGFSLEPCVLLEGDYL